MTYFPQKGNQKIKTSDSQATKLTSCYLAPTVNYFTTPTWCNLVFFPVPATAFVFQANVTAVEGSTVILVCTAEGNPTPHVAWIAPNGTVLQNRTTDTNLTLPNVSRHSSGTYQCKATNELGFDSATVNLDVWCKCFCSFLGFRRNDLRLSFNIFSKVDHPHRSLFRFTWIDCFVCLLLSFISLFYSDFLGVVVDTVAYAVAVSVIGRSFQELVTQTIIAGISRGTNLHEIT